MWESFLSLDTTMQVFWATAAISSAIFIIQALLTVIGIDSVDGMDADFDTFDGDTMDTGGAMSLFSIRSMINFFVGFGWTGICLRSVITNDILLFIVAILVGLGLGYSYILLWKKLKKFESNGAVSIGNCVGKEANVYLRIPGEGKGRGKVQISINGSVHEFDAMTEGEEIATGDRVMVERVSNNVVFVVKG